MKKFFMVVLLFALTFTIIYSSVDDLFSDEAFFRVEEQIVLSASRRPQRLSDAPVSISVITRDEIEKLGVESIPEALVMAAGVYVQRNTNSQYEVSLRGTMNIPDESGPFASLSRRILVLIDGRSFFNDFWGGTIWEFLPITLNDIDRIEVVRGPSSALFGANAASGVINIITLDPSKTEDRIIKANLSFGKITGNMKNNIHYSDKFDNLFVSISAEKMIKERFEYQEFDASKGYFVPGRGARGDDNYPPADEEALNSNKAALNLNYKLNNNQTIDFKAGYSDGHQNFIGATGDYMLCKTYMEMKYGKLSYQYLLNDKIFKLSYSELNMMYGEDDGPNRAGGNNDGIQNGVSVHSKDFEFESILPITERNILVAGFNLRKMTGKSDAIYFMTSPGNKKQDFNSIYLNNEYSFIIDKLKLITAVRMDDFSAPDKTEYSPQIVLFFRPEGNHTFKLNYSEAIRTPFIVENFLHTRTNPPGVTALQNFFPEIGNVISWSGNDELDIPRIKSLELSYSTQFSDKSNLDIALFTHTKSDIITFDPNYDGDPFDPTDRGPTLALSFQNISEKYKTVGLEMAYKKQLTNNWNLWSNYTYQTMKLGNNRAAYSPNHIANAGIMGRLTDNLSLSVYANAASKTDVPITNVMDFNLDKLAVDGDPTPSSVQTAFIKYLTYGDTYDIGLGNMAAFHDTLTALVGAGQADTATNLFLASLGADGSGSLQDIYIREYILKDAVPALTDDEITVLNGLTSMLVATSMLQESAQNVAEEKTGGYLLFNMNMSYKLTDYADFSFTALNLLNKKHRQFAYGEVLGASYYASVKMKF